MVVAASFHHKHAGIEKLAGGDRKITEALRGKSLKNLLKMTKD